jgi:hypothetical protein
VDALAVAVGSRRFSSLPMLRNALMDRLLRLLERVKGIEPFTDNPQLAQIEHISGDELPGRALGLGRSAGTVF